MAVMPESEKISVQEWRDMTDEEQLEYVRILEKSDWELREILKLIECPKHGPCIPYFKQWLRRLMRYRVRHGIA